MSFICVAPSSMKIRRNLIDSEIRMGAFYDPRLLPDYRGAYFQLVRNKLRQLDVWSSSQPPKLIPPWKFYEELRPGTLLLVKATLHVFLFYEDNILKQKVGTITNICMVLIVLECHQVYQINGHSILVVTTSNVSVEERPILTLHGQNVTHTSSDTGTSANLDVATSTFDSFSVSPLKKAKYH